MSKSDIQAVIFDSTHWSIPQASYWLKSHGYNPIKRVDRTTNFLRYRIREPQEFARFSTQKINHKGKLIELIIGYY